MVAINEVLLNRLDNWVGDSQYAEMNALQLLARAGVAELLKGNDLLQLRPVIKNAVESHSLADQITNRQVDLLMENPNCPGLLVSYFSSLRNSEAIATLNFALRFNKRPHQFFHVRFLEANINQKPSLIILAMQRYTDDSMSPLEKPLYTYTRLVKKNKGESIEPILPLKTSNPKRYAEYNQTTLQMTKLEKECAEKFPLVALLSTIAYAKARGCQQFFLTTYDNQAEVKRHRRIKADFPGVDTFEIPNVYDPTAVAIGMTQVGNWWKLETASSHSLTIPEKQFQALSPTVKGIAQAAFAGFNQLLFEPQQTKRLHPHLHRRGNEIGR